MSVSKLSVPTFRLLPLLAGIAVAGEVPTDHWFSARTWLAEDGLQENRVVGAERGTDGYLWVATQSGVVRFDGNRFEPVDRNLFSGAIWGLAKGADGDLWMSMEGGTMVRIRNGEVGKFGAEIGFPANEIQRSVVTDRAGTLWVSYSGGEVVRFSGGKVRKYGEGEGLPSGGLAWLAADVDGRVWYCCNGEVGILGEGDFESLGDFGGGDVRITGSKDGGIWVSSASRILRLGSDGAKLTGDGFALPEGVEPDVIHESSDGALWIGTLSSGLYRFHSGVIEAVDTSNPNILSISEDADGNLWVGTRGGGLNRINPRLAFLNNPDTGFPVEDVISICEAADGRLWVIGRNGLIARSKGDGWETVPSPAAAGKRMNCVAADASGNVWFGAAGGGVHRFYGGKFTEVGLREKLDGRFVRALCCSKAGDLWITADGSGAIHCLRAGGAFERFDLPEGHRFVRALDEASDGAIWAGASDGLLVRISESRLEVMTRKTGGRSIRCIHGASNGDIWIGTPGHGAGRLHDGDYRVFAAKEGIPNSFVSQILADGMGGVWFAGNQGLFQVREDDFDDVAAGKEARLTPVICGRNEGMTGLQASFDFSPSAVRTTDGRLFFSMLTGLAEVRPGNEREPSTPPPALIENLKADGKIHEFHPPLGRAVTEGTLHLPPGTDKILFEFTGLNFATPERTRFRYRLEGLENDWVDAGTKRYAEYSHPPPGEYRFQVMASAGNGVWSREADSLPLVLGAYFWETNWFKAVSVVLGAAATAGIASLLLRIRHRREVLRIEHQRALESERARIARDLHDDLGVGLTEIGLLGDLAGEGEEHREISERARSLAASLDEIVWAINPANDTPQSLVDYFFPYAQKLLGKASIRCRLEVVEPLPAGQLDPEERHEFFHAFKESLNNIIRHSGAGEAKIRFSGDQGVLRIQVADDGCGVRAPGESGIRHGLEGMRARLQKLGGSFGINENPDGGTTVTFTIPAGGGGKQ